MSEWTPEAIAEEKARREALEQKGICPDSGETIAFCQRVDICDCFRARAVEVAEAYDEEPEWIRRLAADEAAYRRRNR